MEISTIKVENAVSILLMLNLLNWCEWPSSLAKYRPLLGGSFKFWTHDWKKVDKVWTIRSYSDVGDLKLMTSFECHQHLQVVPKTFRLKHPSPTSLWPPRAIETMLLKLYKDCRWFWIAQSRDIQKMIQSPACLISVLFRIREVFR